MSELNIRRASLSMIAIMCAGLSGCGTVEGSGARALSLVTPYKIDIVQGNVVTREQLALLKPGLSRNAVREVVGTPLLTSVFHADRWDFVFTLRRQGTDLQSRKVTVFFKNDVLDTVVADELPSEAEFVATLKSTVSLGNRAQMEASEESLKKFPPAKPVPPLPAMTAAPVEYPPLESTAK
jgi:outer membrane protein assembly factor BamE